MKRYSIMVCEYGSNHEVELCQVAENPEELVTALNNKRLKIFKDLLQTKKSSIKKYSSVRVIDNEALT